MEPNLFASSAVTPWGYEADLVTPVQLTSSCMISLWPKREKIEKQFIERQQGSS
jgi:hypothetical protein